MFEFCHSFNILKKRSTGFAPYEILKGHMPPELIRGTFNFDQIDQPKMSASEIIEKVWENRNVSNFDKTVPSQEEPDALVGQSFTWEVGINNKKVNGKCIRSLPTAVRLELEKGRKVWVPRSSVRPFSPPSLSI